MIVKDRNGFKYKIDLEYFGPVVLVKFTMQGVEIEAGFEIPILRKYLSEYLLKIRIQELEPTERAIYN